MSAADPLWSAERALWLGGAEVYADTLHDDALMVFAPPVGVLDRAATLRSIADAPRWTSVDFSDRRIVCPAADVALLAYRARADRGQRDAAYEAMCSSTWLRSASGWRLALHQQTPVLDGDGDSWHSSA